MISILATGGVRSRSVADVRNVWAPNGHLQVASSPCSRRHNHQTQFADFQANRLPRHFLILFQRARPNLRSSREVLIRIFSKAPERPSRIESPNPQSIANYFPHFPTTRKNAFQITRIHGVYLEPEQTKNHKLNSLLAARGNNRSTSSRQARPANLKLKIPLKVKVIGICANTSHKRISTLLEFFKCNFLHYLHNDTENNLRKMIMTIER